MTDLAKLPRVAIAAVNQCAGNGRGLFNPRMAGARKAPGKGLTLRWSDPRFRAIVWQVIIVGLIVAGIWVSARPARPPRPS